ncbi:hypothetical protein EJB05_02412, partial [Eragrostis curvula]
MVVIPSYNPSCEHMLNLRFRVLAERLHRAVLPADRPLWARTRSYAMAADAADKVVEVVPGKGCLKRKSDGRSDGSSRAAKKVTFIFKENEEAGEALVAAQVSGGCNATPDMDFTGMTRRELNALCREHGLSTRGSTANLAASLADTLSAPAAVASAEKVVEVVVVKGCMKRSRDGRSNSSSRATKEVTFIFKEKEEAGETPVAAQVNRRGRPRECVETDARKRGASNGNAAGVVCPDARVTRSRTNAVNLRVGSGIGRHNNILEEETAMIGATIASASAQAGVSRRSTRKSTSCTAADTRIQSQNDPAEEEGEVIGEVGHTKLERRTAGKHKARETLPATAVSGRGRRYKCSEEHGRSSSSAEGVTGEVDGDARETRSKKKVSNLHADSGVESRDILLVEAGDKEEVVRKAVDTKWKQRAPQSAENVAANTHAGISRRSTRSSSLSADDVKLCSVVEKKRGRKAGDCEDEMISVDKKAAEVQDFATSESPVVIESKRSQRKREYCKLDVQKSAKVAISSRVTRSCSVNVAVALPIVIENKRNRKTETVHQDRMVPAVSESDVHRNNVPVTRSLRNKALQNNNTMLEETHIVKKLEKKRQPRGRAIGKHQQFASSVEEKGQAAIPYFNNLVRHKGIIVYMRCLSYHQRSRYPLKDGVWNQGRASSYKVMDANLSSDEVQYDLAISNEDELGVGQTGGDSWTSNR